MNFKVYGLTGSGNNYKVRLLLAHLGEPYDWEEIPSTRIKPRTPEFLKINPDGKVPVLVTKEGELLRESNAILCYLGEGTPFWTGDGLARARVLQWMFFEQFGHEPYLAVARSIHKYATAGDPEYDRLPHLHEKGYHALDVMEHELGQSDFLGGNGYSVADIALFAYTHMAGEGGFDLEPYGGIRRWIERVKEQPGFVALPG